MKICEALRRSVRLELNHIYTEGPFETPTGTDMGWFCREHALHVTALAELLGESAQLCCGDIIVRIPGEMTVYTMGSGDDHAWCRVDDKAPVDASMTLRHLAPNETDVSAICPDRPEELAGFILRYEQKLDETSFARFLRSPERLIAYNEMGILPTNILEVLADPYSFLHPPQGGRSFPEIYGPDVFFAITQHLFKLALGDCKPLRTYRTPKAAVRAIVRHNPTAREFINNGIRAARP